MRKSRKGRGLLVALLLAAVVSSITFAATLSTKSVTLNVTAATGDIATTTVASGQPDWGGILPPAASEILRPNAAGDETAVAVQFPASGAHWEKVDDVTSDEDVTYVGTNNSSWQEDLYNISNRAQGAGTINYVRVWAVVRTTGAASQASAYIHIKTNGVEYNGDQVTVPIIYTAYSYQWNTNPQTGSAWTWTEIDNLQAGVGLRRAANGVYTQCTQVYTEVNYRYIPISGSVPTGNLFTITPHADYPGDLAIKVYMVNTSSLVKAYHALNINLYLPGSAEADQTPNYKILTLDNGKATFNLPDGAGIARTLRVTGGSYQLVSNQPGEWQSGWSLTPELFIEVTQR